MNSTHILGSGVGPDIGSGDGLLVADESYKEITFTSHGALQELRDNSVVEPVETAWVVETEDKKMAAVIPGGADLTKEEILENLEIAKCEWYDADSLKRRGETQKLLAEFAIKDCKRRLVVLGELSEIKDHEAQVEARKGDI